MVSASGIPSYYARATQLSVMFSGQ